MSSNDLDVSDIPISPANSMLLSLMEALSGEYATVSYRALSFLDTGPQSKANAIDNVCALFDRKHIALINNTLYEKSYEKINVPPVIDGSRTLRDGDTFLIVGFGGVACELALFLAKTVECQIIIVTRSAQFNEKKQAVIDELSSNVNRLEVFETDITSSSDMTSLKAFLIKNNLLPTGIINCAGKYSAASIRELNSKDVINTLQAKTIGTLNLLNTFRDIDLRFCYFFSSSTTLRYTIGSLAYFTSNAFVDACVKYYAQSMPVYNIKWGMWRDIGMSNSSTLEILTDDFFKYREKYSFSSEDGVEAFRRALACNCSELLITSESVDCHNVERVNTPNRVKNPETQAAAATEEEINKLRAIWCEVLSVNQVSLEDSFFDLGGHSLMAVQLVNKSNKAFNTNLSLQQLFQSPTMSGVINHLR